MPLAGLFRRQQMLLKEIQHHFEEYLPGDMYNCILNIQM